MKNDAMIGGPELICADCGVGFRARRVTDGVEEICDDCYEARFPTLSVQQHSTTKLRDHLAAD